jgi:hypothetical protein
MFLEVFGRPRRCGAPFRATVAVLACAFVIPSAFSNEPLFRIGDRTYDFISSLGVSKKELRTLFDAEVRKVSEDEIKGWLTDGGRTELPRPIRNGRTELEQLLWEFALNTTADHAFRVLVLASITDRIVATHRIDLADYFRMEDIRSAMKRQVALGEFFYATKDAPAEQNERLYEQARRKYRTSASLTFKEFADVRRRTKASPFFDRWYLESAKAVESQWAKAFVAHYLVKEACEKGVYWRNAREYVEFMHSAVCIVDLENYRGDDAALRRALSKISTKDGTVIRGGLVEFRNSLVTYSPSVTVSATTLFGSKAPVSRQLPTMGAIYRPKPGSVRCFFWETKFVPSKKDEANLQLFYQNHGYQFAAEDLALVVEGLTKEFEPNMRLALQALSVPGRNRVPGVEMADPVLKPYPGKPFEDLVLHQALLDTFAVKLAGARLSDDLDNMMQLHREIEKAMKSIQADVVRRSLTVMVDDLKKLIDAKGRPER